MFFKPKTSLFVAVSIIALQLSRLSYFALPTATLMLARPVQPLNAEPSMLVTLLGIAILVRPVQPLKAEEPMLVTLLGISMLVRPVQPLKAEEAMLITPSGMVTFTRPVRLNTPASIVVKDSEI